MSRIDQPLMPPEGAPHWRMACAWPLMGLACLMSEVSAAPSPAAPHKPARQVQVTDEPGADLYRQTATRFVAKAVNEAWASLAAQASPDGQMLSVATRIEVRSRPLDERLRLAPCAQVQAELPGQWKLWGPTRIALRCTGTPGVKWQVYVPVEVKVFAPSLVASRALPAGTMLDAGDLKWAEVDITAEASPAVMDLSGTMRRELARSLPEGQALRLSHLKARVFFGNGDVVRVVARGAGFSVVSEGVAVGPGVEGQPARVKTESGRWITGTASAERTLEVTL